MNPDYRDMLSVLCEERAEFLLVGAYSLAAHGLPRATGHLDLWIRPSAENADRVWAAIAKFGAPLHDLSEKDLATPGIVFQIGVEPRRIDMLTSIEGVDFEEAWSNRIEVEIEGLKIPVISKGDLIKNKRVSGRPQDVADVARLERGGS